MSFRIGQKVVCVDAPDAAPSDDYPEMPKAGEVYTIRACRPGTRTARMVVMLVEIKSGFGPDGLENCFWASRFRPVIERKTETGMAILRKIASDITTKITEKV